MDEQCKNCGHYLRHYTFDKRRIFQVCCGHCTLGRPRRKLPESKACDDFIPGSAQEDAFASKEYLSKELLKYVLSLELLPEIKKDKDSS